MIPDLPIEFIVKGTAISLQATNTSRMSWKQQIIEAGRKTIPADAWCLEQSVSVTIYYFPYGEMIGDIDNIVKPIIDAMNKFIYMDDHQVERIVVQKFAPEAITVLADPSATLLTALRTERPAVYIRVTDTPLEECK